MRDHSHILAAYDSMSKAARDDARRGSKHDRHNRGFVRVKYADKEIAFYPPKAWASTVGVSVVTLRNWIKRGFITTYQMHGMNVMCKAELVELHKVVAKWHGSRDMHNAIEPEFQADLKESLVRVRLALDTFKRQLPMTPAMTDIIQPSIKD